MEVTFQESCRLFFSWTALEIISISNFIRIYLSESQQARRKYNVKSFVLPGIEKLPNCLKDVCRIVKLKLWYSQICLW